MSPKTAARVAALLAIAGAVLIFATAGLHWPAALVYLGLALMAPVAFIIYLTIKEYLNV